MQGVKDTVKGRVRKVVDRVSPMERGSHTASVNAARYSGCMACVAMAFRRGLSSIWRVA